MAAPTPSDTDWRAVSATRAYPNSEAAELTHGFTAGLYPFDRLQYLRGEILLN